MALFWYNVNPNLEVDQQTLHAGCPVLKGHKWSECIIVNRISKKRE